MKKETLLKLIAWERAYLRDYDNDAIFRLFQGLIDTGEIQDMDYFYQHMARTFIEMGYCYRPELKVIK